MGNTDFLFARPSFIEGMARTLDMFTTLQEYNKSATEEEADAWAIYNDFKVVGEDLQVSMNAFAESFQP